MASRSIDRGIPPKPQVPYQRLNIKRVPNGFRGANKVKVQLWYLTRDWIFRLSPHAFNGVRIQILRWFGAKIARSAVIRPSADITYPWNVSIGEYSYIGDRVCLYSLGEITIGDHVSVSMGTTVCTGTHDHYSPEFPLVIRPVRVHDEVWIGAEAFIGPGVEIMPGGVLGARSVILKGVIDRGEIWAGFPATRKRSRLGKEAAGRGVSQ